MNLIPDVAPATIRDLPADAGFGLCAFHSLGMADPIRSCVYILASRRHGTLYVGVTRDLLRRMWLHRQQRSGFCARYAVTRLFWYGPFADMTAAIAHEKRLKRWRRQWKIELIEQRNPEWRDMYPELAGCGAADGSRLSAASPLRPG